MTLALVAAGGNLGAPEQVLPAALAAVGRLPGTRLVARSTLHPTAPEQPGDGGPFLNAACLVETSLGPRELLDGVLAIERRFGRRRTGRRGPRTLDLDLVLFGAERRAERGLVVPHPSFRARAFVLAPAVEVAPGLVDPATGLTVAQLLAALRAERGEGAPGFG